jgi:hypothetical protein
MDRSKVKNNHFDPVPSSKERYGIQLNVETIPEIMFSKKSPGTQSITPLSGETLGVVGTLKH